jgi:hypothetical protein
MAAQDRTTPVRCDMCGGGEGDGVDEAGRILCPYCAGRLRGDRDGEARGLAVVLMGAVAAALLEGLPPTRIREIVESEITASEGSEA